MLRQAAKRCQSQTSASGAGRATGNPARPADTDLARWITVLARAHQGATWRRTKASNELRSRLREYFPAFLEVFAGSNATNLASSDARPVLAIAATPLYFGRAPSRTPCAHTKAPPDTSVGAFVLASRSWFSVDRLTVGARFVGAPLFLAGHGRVWCLLMLLRFGFRAFPGGGHVVAKLPLLLLGLAVTGVNHVSGRLASPEAEGQCRA